MAEQCDLKKWHTNANIMLFRVNLVPRTTGTEKGILGVIAKLLTMSIVFKAFIFS